MKGRVDGNGMFCGYASLFNVRDQGGDMLDGLSIGFRTVVAGRDPARRARLLKAVDLWEISLVTFPMMPGARIGGLRDMTHRGCATAGGGRVRAPQFLTAKGDGCT